MNGHTYNMKEVETVNNLRLNFLFKEAHGMLLHDYDYGRTTAQYNTAGLLQLKGFEIAVN